MSKRKYNPSWENETWARGWLVKNEDGFDRNDSHQDARCKVCRVNLRSHAGDLQRHGKPKNHTEKFDSINLPTNKKLLNYVKKPVSEEQKIAAIKISAHIAVHSSIRTVDRLVDVMKPLAKGSIMESIKLNRTKCSSIIKNVISPAMLTELVEAIGNNGYSLIVDESIDVSVTKYMCLCVKYLDRTKGKLLTDFLGMFLVEEATARCLYQSVCDYLETINLPRKNMTAIGTDGASNLCGRKESLYALLEKDIPNLQLLRCSCHSIHLCSCKAAEELPSSLEYLVKEVYNWFKQSPLRHAKYKRLFDTINAGVETNRHYQLIQLFQTHWLAFHDACKRILEQWLELKTHFNIVSQTEKCYGTRMIHSMLQDESNRLYLIFVKNILAQMQSLNLTFQSDKVDAGSAYDEMYTTFLSIANKILKPTFLVVHRDGLNLLVQVCDALDNDLAFLPLESVDFGFDFMAELATTSLSSEKVLEMKKRCFNFMKRLLTEMSQRLPVNMEIFKKYKLLSPMKCLGPEKVKFCTIVEVLSPFFNPEVEMEIYESQWKKLNFVDWKMHCSNILPVSIIDFWPVVYAFADGAGRFSSRELAEAALRMLCAPTSNACVERVFSVMNLVKTRVRNKMGLSMLEALLRIKVHFNVIGSCCTTFVPSEKMMSLFTASNIYGNRDDDNEIEEDENDDIFEIADNFL